MPDPTVDKNTRKRFSPGEMSNLLKKLPARQSDELQNLKKYDKLIVTTLAKDTDMARLFFLDPGAALKKMGVPLSPELATLLEKNKMSADSLRTKQYLFPDGEVVTPRVTVRFTGIRGR
jgi:hypothetical protein